MPMPFVEDRRGRPGDNGCKPDSFRAITFVEVRVERNGVDRYVH